MTTSPPLGGHDRPTVGTPGGLHDAVVDREHVMITHLAVIEGWLEQLEDDALDGAQRRRAAQVVRQRTEVLRRDLCALLGMVKDYTSHAHSPGQ